VGLVLLLCSVYTSGHAQKLTPVNVGYLPLISYTPIFIAMEQGYYAEAGIDVNLLNFPSAGKMITALATGDLAVAAGSSSAALYNAVAEGLEKVFQSCGFHLRLTPQTHTD
jgi:NitT/TauT family transport system substrate-binding protein